MKSSKNSELGYEVRIFLPKNALFGSEHWAENALGCIIKPLVEKYRPKSYWFTRYQVSTKIDGGGSEKVPTDFYYGGDVLRSIRFRFIAENKQQKTNIVRFGNKLIKQFECVSSKWSKYSHIGDIGGNRFTRHDLVSLEERQKTTEDMIKFLDGASSLVLRNLELGNDYNFRLAKDPIYIDKMMSPYHLISNMTGIFYDLVAVYYMGKIKFKHEKWYKILHLLPMRLLNNFAAKRLAKHFGGRYWR